LKWLRGGLLAAVIGMGLLALTQARQVAPPQATAAIPTELAEPVEPLVEPTPRPTRVPLPTAPPQVIISRIARETPIPRPTATPYSEPRVDLVDNGYQPSELVVKVGASVLWFNAGHDGHDVTGRGPDGPWRSGLLGPADRYQRPFMQPGNYDFMCSLHPEMRGRIVVQP
jgi:hypothetical protein